MSSRVRPRKSIWARQCILFFTYQYQRTLQEVPCTMMYLILTKDSVMYLPNTRVHSFQLDIDLTSECNILSEAIHIYTFITRSNDEILYLIQKVKSPLTNISLPTRVAASTTSNPLQTSPNASAVVFPCSSVIQLEARIKRSSKYSK